MQKRLLVLGASELQLPLILKAKSMGLHVGVVDYNPHATGIQNADEYFNVSTIDEEGVLKAAESFRADGIVTMATDMPMRAIAYTCEKLSLAGISYETALKATDKLKMMDVFRENRINHPWYYSVDNNSLSEEIIRKLTYPLICKPTDNSGSRGVVLVNKESELESSIHYSASNSRTGHVILEEYLTGHEVSVEILVYNGDVKVVAVTDKLTTGAPHFVEMGHSQPSGLPQKDLLMIKDLATRAVRAIGIVNGAAHVEIMQTADGPKIIELGARLGGDNITSHLVPLSTGIDMVGAVINISLGKAPVIGNQISKGAAIRYLHVPVGKIETITGVDDAYGVCENIQVRLNKKIGDSVSLISNSAERAGYVIAQADTAQDAVSCCEKALSKITVILSGSEQIEECKESV